MMSSAYALNDDIKCIDTSAFLCEMTLSNKNCFWSLLQSQTDKMHYYYQDQVQSILHCLDKFEDHHKVRRKYRTSYVISSLQRAKLSTEHLNTFLQSSFRDFKLVVKKFDEYHSTNTLEEEIDFFHSCHDYIDGKSLNNLIRHIEERIEIIETDSRFKEQQLSFDRDSSWTERATRKMTTQLTEKSKDGSGRSIQKEKKDKEKKSWFVRKLPFIKVVTTKRKTGREVDAWC